MMTRYLGIDFGAKRIGLAVNDPGGPIVSPLATVPSHGGGVKCINAIASYAREYEVQELVVGLPLNMDGTEGPQAQQTRAFGHHLARVTKLPIHYFDERLSSVDASQRLADSDLTRKKLKARQDRVAAQVILEGFLASRSAD